MTKLPSTENWHVKALRKIQALFLALILLALVGCQAADVPNSVVKAEELADEASTPQIGFTQGSLAPDFTLRGLDGETYSLSDYRGKPVQLVFWSTGCIYCVMELPELQEHYQAEEGYEVLALNATFQDSVETVEEQVEQMGLSFPVLLMESREDVKIATDYNVRGIPHNVFINKDGIIEKVQIGMTSGEEAIALLKELAN